MTDARKMMLVRVLYSSRFWIPTFVLYLNSRGIETSQVLSLLGAYYVATIALEYPTGVVGDVFSHRMSIILGYVLLAVSFLLSAFPVVPGYAYFFCVLMVTALGESLISGSDTALLHEVSDDFSRDFPNIKAVSQVVSFAALSVGGFAAVADLRLPFVLSAVAMIGAACFAFSVSYRPKSRNGGGNVLRTAIDGLTAVRTETMVRNLLVVSFLSGSFLFSLKWLYNDLFRQIALPVVWWGVVPGVATLFVAVGTIAYRKRPKLSLTAVFLAFTATVPFIGLTWIAAAPLVSIVFVHFLRGYIESRIMVDINAAIPAEVRSSVLSLGSLLLRLGAAGYMFVGSQLISAAMPLLPFLGFSGLLMAFVGMIPLLSLARRKTAGSGKPW
ncbi:MAG: MFS transporter [Candidatus Moranbacteria bacterium]|nr:MFS transporter [Candidatus Moranbacteria bacterium]